MSAECRRACLSNFSGNACAIIATHPTSRLPLSPRMVVRVTPPSSRRRASGEAILLRSKLSLGGSDEMKGNPAKAVAGKEQHGDALAADLDRGHSAVLPQSGSWPPTGLPAH